MTFRTTINENKIFFLTPTSRVSVVTLVLNLFRLVILPEDDFIHTRPLLTHWYFRFHYRFNSSPLPCGFFKFLEKYVNYEPAFKRHHLNSVWIYCTSDLKFITSFTILYFSFSWSNLKWRTRSTGDSINVTNDARLNRSTTKAIRQEINECFEWLKFSERIFIGLCWNFTGVLLVISLYTEADYALLNYKSIAQKWSKWFANFK